MLLWSLLVMFIIMLCVAGFCELTNPGYFKIMNYVIIWILISFVVSVGAYYDELNELKNKNS